MSADQRTTAETAGPPGPPDAKSRGTVRLRSNDYRDKPAVDPRYFTDPEGHDMAVAVAGIRLAREIVSQPAMAAWAGGELAPGEQAQTDEEIADYVRRTHNTVYHPVGSVRMGADDDAMSPLDARLRVKGVTGLRVADDSVMPEHVTVNPQHHVLHDRREGGTADPGRPRLTTTRKRRAPGGGPPHLRSGERAARRSRRPRLRQRAITRRRPRRRSPPRPAQPRGRCRRG